jgi:hypothetical protein
MRRNHSGAGKSQPSGFMYKGDLGGPGRAGDEVEKLQVQRCRGLAVKEEEGGACTWLCL